jgi:hypothetical protein
MHRGYSIFVVVGELPKVVYDPLSLCLYLTSSFESKIETADSAWKKAPKPPKSTATSQNTATTATEEDAALQVTSFCFFESGYDTLYRQHWKRAN